MRISAQISVIVTILACVSASCLATDLDSFFARVKGNTLEERIDSAGLVFYGLPYVDAPLGDGAGSRFDQGPLFRFDAFDCTTFVETVLALATAKKASEFEKRLMRIRYRNGKISFVERNHFPCVDWIAQNTQSGLLTDITNEIGQPWGTAIASAKITKKQWFEKLPLSIIRVEGISDSEREKRLAELHSAGARFAPVTPSVPYIVLEKIITRKAVAPEEIARRKAEEADLAARLRTEEERAPQGETTPLEKKIHDELIDKRLRYLIQDVEVNPVFLASIPHATVLNIVRPGFSVPGSAMNISHQGFVIQKKEGTFFRHVSRSGSRAKDVPLAHYLRLCLLSPAIKGVHLLRVNEIQ
jgi:hypothetical protein